MNKVFLSGPIRGLPRELSLGWRNEAKRLLEPKLQVFHALRGRETKETLPDPRIAVHRDKRDIRNADILLVNDTFAGASMIGRSTIAVLASPFFDHSRINRACKSVPFSIEPSQ